MTAPETEVASASLWWDGLTRPAPEPPLETEIDAQYAIVGGGYTGLWTAYFIKQLEPKANVVLVETQQIGHGASGRNGGWLMGSLEGLSAFTDTDGTLAESARNTLTRLVSDVGDTLAAAGIDCDFHHGGCIMAAARFEAQTERARKTLRYFRQLGFSGEDYQWLSPQHLVERVLVAKPGGAIFTPHVARIQPAKLVTGLAEAIKKRGVRLFEHTRAHTVSAGRVLCDRGVIRADHIVIATEGYSEQGSPLHRRIVPVQTGMVATEPLSAIQWNDIGLHGRETFADFSRAATYLQRTADNRLVVGARGHYQAGGLPQHSLSDEDALRKHREKVALSLFPQLRGTAFTHSWGGSVGVSRAWHPHVIWDASQRMATAGGYVGEGVGASFLFGQTLAELLTDHPSERTHMPWVQRAALSGLKKWEPEPFPRWGFNALMGTFRVEEWLASRYGRSLPSEMAAKLCDWLTPH
jgi:glycine/D-amino acid oxidase-like deaminating enzyme